jgi:transposase
MAHAKPALTPKHRLRLPRLIVDQGRPHSRAAEFFHVSWGTAAKWAQRYRDERPGWPMGPRPAHPARQDPSTVVRKIVHLRWEQRPCPMS